MKAILFLFVVVSQLFSVNVYADGTVWLSAGVGVSNSVTDERSRAWSVEQETPTHLGTWLFGYLNEGHKKGDKRDGIYALLKAPYVLTNKVETSIAVGPYYTATTITDPDGIHYRDAYCMSLIASAGVKYSLNDRWATQFKWSHVMFAPNNKDADVFIVAVGYRPDW